MIGIIVVGHINFASGLRSAVEAIAGEQSSIEYIDFIPGMSTEQLEINIRQAVEKCQTGEGVLVFTDVAGGSPCNRATAIMSDYSDMRVITGSNLPMIANACLERDATNLDELTSLIVELGHHSIGLIDINSVVTEDKPNDMNDGL
ncbi:PTS galactosamine/N-acetylgalactosamine transporter subunit IIA [Salmonella enterica]|uniref:PTS system mannose-specific transporter subunit IIAB n=2 Tax=Salmonella enterica TaxID=28901 RepID=A0A379QQV6_SALER|nr:PTS galactosamine/N-acetylgalactosamine transporter subunit IIA [Salmonella enterica]ECC1479551.1 PTS sugar transporter subunit IIA [Salmonella enterica subsp. salamae]ASG89768.1 PTS mannose transporter subunit IIA [Salmonella enterica subsp. salamae serovar 55:k:z39 str. 1315K]ECC1654140.1 PTS sugar transporter subunit IIA [Salmonella enterica subsp. salamae]ECD9412587.1 PTS sugar transporter subunit IIA [Salmonella enterica subsp. salamae]ECF5929387.1 PTS sugar transporter subunit IIA [Sa